MRIELLLTVSKRLKDISANVTDVKYLTGGRYCVATIAFYSKELDRHPLLNIGALAFIDMESFAVKTFHITDPNPESVAISYDNNYYLVACQGFRDNFQESLSISGSVMRYELSGANIEFSGRFTFDDDAECDFKLLSGCILRDPHTRLDHITTSPVENIAAVTDQSCNALLMLDIETLRIYRIIDMGFSQHLSDTNDNNTIDFKFTNTLRLEPDGVVFSQNGQYVLTANEGKLDHTDTDDHDLYEFYSGGRNITVLDLSGKKIYDSRHLTEVNEAITGQYNDKHSDTHGSQLESLTIGNVDGNSFLAVTAEKSSVVHFFDIKDMKNIRYLGHVPTGGKAPEGIIYVPVQEVFICANEKSNSISVFEFRKTINRDYNE